MNENIQDIIDEAGIQAFFKRGRDVATSLDKQHMLPSKDASAEILAQAITLTVKRCAALVSDNAQYRNKILNHFGFNDE